MANVIRHGGEAHVVRPDRVYRTSVLTPIYGYQPGVDVQSVLHSFAQGPQGLTQLSGLSSPGLGGALKRLGFRIKAGLAARRARKFGAFAGFGAPSGSPGPATMMASMVSPQMQTQMAMLDHLTQNQNMASVQGAVAAGAYAHSHRRPYTWWYAG